MFDPSIYQARRAALARQMGEGLALFLGNGLAPMNYPANPYPFRQDGAFRYLFGLDQPDLAAVVELPSGRAHLFGQDLGLDDVVWMGQQPSVAHLAASAGVEHWHAPEALAPMLREALRLGRPVHFLPPYRGEQELALEALLDIRADRVRQHASEPLIRAYVEVAARKGPEEIAQMELAMERVTRPMYLEAMRLARPGAREQELAGRLEGMVLAAGSALAYPMILSRDGQILHNHSHANVLRAGDLLLIDAGAQSPLGYATDITRTLPVGGKFSPKQAAIYNIVLAAEEAAIQGIAPGVPYRALHLLASRIIAQGLKDLGLMRGEVEAAVEAGAHALFFPHGLGHMIGMDVHDMEGLGEDFVGYDRQHARSTQFGLAYLRLARPLREGFVVTVEPGVYFIPELIDQWKAQGLHQEFIDYDALDEYRDFGGIRIEDNVLVTATGHRVLGPRIPKTIEEVEEAMR